MELTENLKLALDCLKPEPGVYLPPEQVEHITLTLRQERERGDREQLRADAAEKKLADALNALAMVATALYSVGLSKDSPAPVVVPPPPPVVQGQVAGDVLEGSAALPAEAGTCPTPSDQVGSAADVVSIEPAAEPARNQPPPETKEPANFCQEMNKSAGTRCGALASAGNVGGRWLCKRHSKRTSSAQAQPSPEATNG